MKKATGSATTSKPEAPTPPIVEGAQKGSRKESQLPIKAAAVPATAPLLVAPRGTIPTPLPQPPAPAEPLLVARDYLDLAQAYLKLRYFERAIKNASLAMGDPSTSTQAQYVRGLAALDMYAERLAKGESSERLPSDLKTRLIEASADLDAVAKRDPTRAQYTAQAGRAAFFSGDFTKAVAHLTAATRTDADTLWYALFLAKSHFGAAIVKITDIGRSLPGETRIVEQYPRDITDHLERAGDFAKSVYCRAKDDGQRDAASKIYLDANSRANNP